MSPARARPEIVAIAAIDPGGTSAVARGVFPIANASTIAEAFACGRLIESWEVEGRPADQADEIAEELDDWFIELNAFHSLPIPSFRLVIEDFQLRTQHANLAPVRITERFESLWEDKQWKFEIIKQQPSEAKGYATNDRLRKWGAWVVGSEHRRDAMRHLLARLSKELQ